MNIIVKTFRDLLISIVHRIDNGDCDLSEDEATELVSAVKKYADRDVRMSKYQACEYLHISRATFDNYVSNERIPKGTHQQGFKELYWLKKDLDKFKLERNK